METNGLREKKKRESIKEMEERVRISEHGLKVE